MDRPIWNLARHRGFLVFSNAPNLATIGGMYRQITSWVILIGGLPAFLPVIMCTKRANNTLWLSVLKVPRQTVTIRVTFEIIVRPTYRRIENVFAPMIVDVDGDPMTTDPMTTAHALKACFHRRCAGIAIVWDKLSYRCDNGSSASYRRDTYLCAARMI